MLIGDKGADVLRGGAGNDFINSREPDGSTAVADGVDCGNGFDTVEADLKDNVQADCNDVDRAPVGETPNVNITRQDAAGRSHRPGEGAPALPARREGARLQRDGCSCGSTRRSAGRAARARSATGSRPAGARP